LFVRKEKNDKRRKTQSKARKIARAEGRPLTGELALEGEPICEFSESPKGYEARHKWAKWYDSLNGAPEGEWDR
jgi:hypothetical protein